MPILAHEHSGQKLQLCHTGTDLSDREHSGVQGADHCQKRDDGHPDRTDFAIQQGTVQNMRDSADAQFLPRRIVAKANDHENLHQQNCQQTDDHAQRHFLPGIFDLCGNGDNELYADEQKECQSQQGEHIAGLRGEHLRLFHDLTGTQLDRSHDAQKQQRTDQPVCHNILHLGEHVYTEQVQAQQKQNQHNRINRTRNGNIGKDTAQSVAEHGSLRAAHDGLTCQITAYSDDDGHKRSEARQRVLRHTACQVRHQSIQLTDGKRRQNVKGAGNRHGNDKRQTNGEQTACGNYQADTSRHNTG